MRLCQARRRPENRRIRRAHLTSLMTKRMFCNRVSARGFLVSPKRIARKFCFALIAVFAGLCLTAHFGAAVDRTSFANFDKRISAAKVAPVPHPEQLAARDRLKQLVPGAAADFDPLLGSPKWICSPGGALTGVHGEGGGVPADVAKHFDKDPDKALKNFLQAHRALFRHGAEVLDGAVKQRDHTTEHGLRTVAWEQQVDGIPVFDSVLIANTTRQGELLSISSQFVPDPVGAAERGTPNHAAKTLAPPVGVDQAMQHAAADIGEVISESSALDAKPAPKTLQQRFKLKPLPGDASATLVWLPMNADTLRLCWQVELNRREFSERFRFLVDAQTGEVLLRRKLTVELSEVLYRVYTGDSPSPMSPGFAVPTNTQPPYVQRQLVAISNLNAVASPIGWINDGVMETRGNNVDAHLDRDSDDRPDLPRPQATLALDQRRVFDFPIDFNQHPTNYSDAAVVQLFYWCNFMHDKLYELGFTETAGNFQKDNFGRGGANNDAILADAQDGSGLNNANFTPARDGFPGRIQMFIFDGPTPARDGDLDGEVVCHEYTHGLTDRLVGGGVGLDFFGHPQSGGLAEGWSDFYAEALLSAFGDDLGGNYPMGGYLTYEFSGLTQNYYYGIRRYPYSTNLNVDPLTLKDIDVNQASTHSGIPRNPVITSSANEIHRQGEVWCSMLWDMRANLLRKYAPTNAADFTNANMRVLRYVTVGAQLAPPNPSFLQARDAILMAVRTFPESGSDTNEIWAAFARRGLGKSAICPDSSSTIGVVEAFDTPERPVFDVLPHQTFINIVGHVGGPFVPASITNTLVNSGKTNLSWAASVSDLWLKISATNGVIAPNGTVESVLSLTSVANTLAEGSYQASLTYTNVATAQIISQVITLFVLSTQDSSLVVTPPGTFSIQGPAGGAFTPSYQTYRLDNESDLPLNWHAFSTNDWLTIEPASGMLAASPDFANVTVTINSNANALAEGTYAGQVTFINDQTGGRIDAPVLLRVGRIDYLTEDFLPGAFDLQYSTITFTPDHSINFYRVCREPATQFPTDPTGGTVVPLNDDNFQQVTLADNRQVSIFETSSNAIFIGANGSVTFDPGSMTDFFYPGLPSYFAAARVAPFYVDLNPSNTVSISYLQLANRFVVTYDNVPEYGVDNSNSFQIEMFFDGAIRLTWLRVDATNAQYGVSAGQFPSVISGMSRGGGIPADYLPSNLSGVGNCAPSATIILPVRATEGDGGQHGTLLISGPVTNELRVVLSSSDTNEVIVPDMIVMEPGQTSIDFPLGVIDDGLLDGSQPATITAEFPDRLPAQATMLVDDAETGALQVLVPYQGREGDVLSGGGIVNVITPGFVAERSLTVYLESNKPSRVRVPPSVVIPAGQNSASFDIVLVDNNLLDGEEDVGIKANVVNWTGDGDLITVTDNESTALALTLPGEVTEGQGAIANGGRAYLSGIAVSNIVIALRSERPELISVPAFVTNVTGQSSVPFDLNIGDNTVINNFDSIRVYASATGFINATGSVALIDDERPVVPSNPSPADLATHVARDTTLAWTVNSHAPPTTVYDVYFSTNATLSTNDLGALIASTTSLSAPVPRNLDPETTYYWMVVARLAPFTPVSSPVWSFTTATLRFDFGKILSPQYVDEPFPVTLAASDEFGLAVTNYAGSATLTNSAPVKSTARIVISAIDTAGLRRVQFANVSGQTINIAGWQIAVYDWVTWPAPRLVFTVPAPSVSAPGDVFNLLGLPAQFAPGSYPNFAAGLLISWNNNVDDNPVAVLLRDNFGNIVDFVCASGADPALITSPALIPAEQWSSSPIAANIDTTLTYQRIGQRDQNNSNDWVTAARLTGTNNPALLIPFTNSAPVAFTFTLNNFLDGMATGTVTMLKPAYGVTFGAIDARGHGGVGAPIDVFARNDIALSGTADAAVLVSQPITYQFTVTNTGPNPANAVTLIDTLATNSAYSSALSSQGACSFANGIVTCQLGTLEPQQIATVSITAIAAARGVLTNFAKITRSETDAYQNNNTATQVSVATFPQVSIFDVTNAEPDMSNTTMTFTLRLSASNALTAAVGYATSDGTATGGADYEATSGTVIFPPGVTERTISVTILGDLISEGAENFFVNLSNAVNADLTRTSAVGTINDNDPLPLMSIADASITEGDAGTTNAIFTVQLATVSGRTVTVSYATTNGTALAGLDYVEIYGSLQFPPGTTNATISVPILGDTIPEPTKSFFVNLSSAVNAFATRSQGVGTILDNDVAPIDHFAFDSVSPLVSYTNTPLPVTITARDGNGALASGFNDSFTLVALEAPRTLTIGTSNTPWALPMGTSFHDARLQSIYQTNEIGAAGSIVAVALDVATAPSQVLSNWTIRLRHTLMSQYFVPAWETNWSTNFQHDVSIVSTGWVIFPFSTPFDYNGHNHLMIDFSFDNSSFSADGLCRSTTLPQVRSMYQRSDSAFGHPTDWNGTNPPAILTSRIPNTRLIVARDIAFESTAPARFVNGVWSGTVKILDAATNLVLHAVDDAGHFGESNPVSSHMLQVAGITRTGNSVTISFLALNGSHYFVESSAGLTANWITISPLLNGDGTEIHFTYDSVANQQFYRVRLVP